MRLLAALRRPARAGQKHTDVRQTPMQSIGV